MPLKPSFVLKYILKIEELAGRSYSLKVIFLKVFQISQDNTYDGASFLCHFINKETPVQVFSFEFWEIFKSTYFAEHLQTAASEICFLFF